MSPATRAAPSCWSSFPRVSGDEPALELVAEPSKRFSPRERG